MSAELTTPEKHDILVAIPVATIKGFFQTGMGENNFLCSFDTTTKEGKEKLWKSMRSKSGDYPDTLHKDGFPCDSFSVVKQLYKTEDDEDVLSYKVTFFWDKNISACCVSPVVARQLLEYCDVFGNVTPENPASFVIKEAGNNPKAKYYSLDIFKP